MRSAQLTNISDPAFIALSNVRRCCHPKSNQHLYFFAQMAL